MSLILLFHLIVRYHEKAQEDMKEVQASIHGILEYLSLKTDAISKDEIARFCKNASFLKVIRYTSLEVKCSCLFRWRIVSALFLTPYNLLFTG